MPKIIVKTEYIQSTKHMQNYLAYAGLKLEAQTLIYDGDHEYSLSPDIFVNPDSLAKKPVDISLTTSDGKKHILPLQVYQRYVTAISKSVTEKTIATHDDNDNEILMDFHPARYVKYISTRPGAEKAANGSALFDLNGSVDVVSAQKTVARYHDHVWWAHIVSLTRADAERTGFDHREAWENLVRSKAYAVAKAYNISPENLILYCAYHNKELNPHIHLFMTSSDEKESIILGGKKSMAAVSRRIKSLFFNEIFRGDVAYLKDKKNMQEQELKEKLIKSLQALQHNIPDSEIVSAFLSLVGDLQRIKGRKVYGYLPADIKEKVNSLLYISMKLPELKLLFDDYMRTRKAFICNYVDKEEIIEKKMQEIQKRFFEPQKKDSRELHNAIIQEACVFAEASTFSSPRTYNNGIKAVQNLLCCFAGVLSSQTEYYNRYNEHYVPRQRHLNITDESKPTKNYMEY